MEWLRHQTCIKQSTISKIVWFVHLTPFHPALHPIWPPCDVRAMTTYGFVLESEHRPPPTCILRSEVPAHGRKDRLEHSVPRGGRVHVKDDVSCCLTDSIDPQYRNRKRDKLDGNRILERSWTRVLCGHWRGGGGEIDRRKAWTLHRESVASPSRRSSYRERKSGTVERLQVNQKDLRLRVHRLFCLWTRVGGLSAESRR